MKKKMKKKNKKIPSSYILKWKIKSKKQNDLQDQSNMHILVISISVISLLQFILSRKMKCTVFFIQYFFTFFYILNLILMYFFPIQINTQINVNIRLNHFFYFLFFKFQIIIFFFFFFFFQAEDGIRDHAQSRGLGDVYKRQHFHFHFHFHSFFGTKAISSISTFTFLGSVLTATQDLAGLFSPGKYLAQISFTLAKSPISAKNIVVFTTLLKLVLASFKTASKFFITYSVQSSMFSETTADVLGSNPIYPDVQSKSVPDGTILPYTQGPIAFGANSVLMFFKNVACLIQFRFF
eukprot:TRINITY_DN4268_c0_g1_i2.p1 TRINITY_DN4268_c0_g1~~TRINITY_DN4268_c0_g1_i2.p1  ORF type:complete len:294 (-),score=42.18 TRINITY_DN4268_c0_g1_i2:295-1176(-)